MEALDAAVDNSADLDALARRLSAHLDFDAGKQRMLENLLAENEELRRQTQALEMENRKLQHTLDLDHRRHREDVHSTEDTSADMYDWIVDIQLLSDVSKQGWRVDFSGGFLHGLDSSARQQIVGSPGAEGSGGEGAASGEGRGKPQRAPWQGAVVAVLGLYDKGKTFVLNSLTESRLPSGKKVATKGLSFKHVEVDGGTRFVLLDSEGSYSPVRVCNELSVVEKEATELFLQELITEMSDYFLCVVNDFTSLDQRYLDKLTRSLQTSKKDFREVIVVHNCKEVIDEDTLRHVWETQVTAIYGAGTPQSTLVAALDPTSGQLTEKAVGWFKTPFSRHVLLANADSDLGEQLNPWAFSLLRYWLKSVFVPVAREFSVVDAVVHYSNQKLTTHFKTHPQLALIPTEEPDVCYIRSLSDSPEALRLHQVAVDASGIMLARPDSYLPPVDIIRDVRLQQHCSDSHRVAHLAPVPVVCPQPTFPPAHTTPSSRIPPLPTAPLLGFVPGRVVSHSVAGRRRVRHLLGPARHDARPD